MFCCLILEDVMIKLHVLEFNLGRTLHFHIPFLEQCKFPLHTTIPIGTDATISKIHAKLFFDFTCNTFFIQNYGKNPIIVDKQFVVTHQMQSLQAQSELYIGNVFLLFQVNTSFDPHSFLQPQPLYSATSSVASKLYQFLDESSEETKKKTRTSFAIDFSSYQIFEKPNFSYQDLITEALDHSTTGELDLQSIYSYIETKYPYYKFQSQADTKSSIRHVCSTKFAKQKGEKSSTSVTLYSKK